MRWQQFIFDVICPKTCILCCEPLEDEEILCSKCDKLLLWTGTHAVQTGKHFDLCLSPLFYTEQFKRCFHRYKFSAQWQYSRIYGDWMWHCLKTQQPDWQRFDCITWTPISIPRWLSRGYDQSQQLAQMVAKQSGLPLRSLLLRKHTQAQSHTQHAEQRWNNVKDAYRVTKADAIRGKRILLVDDIITTGATLEEASRILKQAGAVEVCCLTLARGIAVK